MRGLDRIEVRAKDFKVSWCPSIFCIVDIQIIPVTVGIVKNYDQGSIKTETHLSLVNESEHFKVFSCFSEMQSCLELRLYE